MLTRVNKYNDSSSYKIKTHSIITQGNLTRIPKNLLQDRELKKSFKA